MGEGLVEKEITLKGREILPGDIGETSSFEAKPLLARAAYLIEILNPKTEFWRGLVKNLRGVAAYIETRRSKLTSKIFKVAAGASFVATVTAACAPIIEPTAPGYEDLEIYRARIGLCGLSGDVTGVVSWFQLVEEEGAPPLGEVRTVPGGERFGYNLVEQSIGNAITGDFTVPDVKECQRIGFREGRVWVYRGLVPVNRFAADK